MTNKMRRTGKTELTDDELILLDILFDGRVRQRMLRRKYFQEQWNYQPHNLDDDELLVTLKKLVDSGFLEITDEQSDIIYAMTPLGGQKWESERLPVWHRFATEFYGRTLRDSPYVTILAITAEARDDLWNLGNETHLFKYRTGFLKKITTKNFDNHSMDFDWKQFPELHALVATIRDRNPLEYCDWERFNQKRTFWRTIGESDKFWGEATNSSANKLDN
ncbi:hypothetical protein [Planctomicrobium piriforme]|uniref:Uncharacterized protein n=1 Tax=Planctomicrobium piriforme TaxID=1576369 RepID=A0A1I3NR86_9PLAN|nr:hypothetical protein [Planctomicrobium piriforme]SFJ11692.1 hypothetical protein SAMN05421753_115173 [Planctomicrobium piriforme]